MCVSQCDRYQRVVVSSCPVLLLLLLLLLCYCGGGGFYSFRLWSRHLEIEHLPIYRLEGHTCLGATALPRPFPPCESNGSPETCGHRYRMYISYVVCMYGPDSVCPVVGHRQNWHAVVVPRLVKWTEGVYHVRSHDQLRYRLLMTLSTTEHMEEVAMECAVRLIGLVA